MRCWRSLTPKETRKMEAARSMFVKMEYGARLSSSSQTLALSVEIVLVILEVRFRPIASWHCSVELGQASGRQVGLSSCIPSNCQSSPIIRSDISVHQRIFQELCAAALHRLALGAEGI